MDERRALMEERRNVYKSVVRNLNGENLLLMSTDNRKKHWPRGRKEKHSLCTKFYSGTKNI
jgi:hypothetical protein